MRGMEDRNAKSSPVCMGVICSLLFFFSSRRRHTRLQGDWSSDVCSSDLTTATNGTLWKVQTNGSGFSVLRAFAANGNEGRRPFAPVTEGADGMIYGVTDIEIGRASCRERV